MFNDFDHLPKQTNKQTKIHTKSINTGDFCSFFYPSIFNFNLLQKKI